MIFRPDSPQILTPTRGVQVHTLGASREFASLYNSLVAFWAMDEASGQRNDSIGTNHLTDNNTVTSGTGLVYATAASFLHTSSEFLHVNDNVPLSTGDVDFWMACWFQIVADSGTAIALISKNATTTNREYRMALNRTAGPVYTPLFLAMNNNTSAGQATWGSGAALSSWHFLIGWHDSVNNLVGISLNNGTPVTTSYSGGAANSTARLTISRLDEVSSWYHRGLMGPVMVGKGYVPTAADRTFLYNSGAGRTLAVMATA